MQVALNGPAPQATPVKAAEVIVVLQNVLKTALQNNEDKQAQLEKAQAKLKRRKEKHAELKQKYEDAMANITTLHKQLKAEKQGKKKPEIKQRSAMQQADADPVKEFDAAAF